MIARRLVPIVCLHPSLDPSLGVGSLLTEGTVPLRLASEILEILCLVPQFDCATLAFLLGETEKEKVRR